MRRGDLDAGAGTETQRGVGQHRSGQRARQHPHVESGGVEDLRRGLGEPFGPVAGVAAQHDRAPGTAFRQPGRETCRGTDDDRGVHAVRSRSHRAADSRGAEGERAGHAIVQFGGGVGISRHRACEQVLQLGTRVVVDVVGDPAECRVPELGCEPGRFLLHHVIVARRAARGSSDPRARSSAPFPGECTMQYSLCRN